MREHFEAMLDADPEDWSTRLVYADWLEEQGEVVAAQGFAAQLSRATHFGGAQRNSASPPPSTAARQFGHLVGSLGPFRPLRRLRLYRTRGYAIRWRTGKKGETG